MTTPDDLHYARFFVDLFAAGIKDGISDLADAAYNVLHDQNIRIKGPDDILDYREEPITKVVLEDIYELEEKIGQPATELKETFLYRHVSKIVETRKYCGHGYQVKSCEDEQCKSGLVDLRTRFPTFHRDLYDALLQVKEDSEEVPTIEDVSEEAYQGSWQTRIYNLVWQMSELEKKYKWNRNLSPLQGKQQESVARLQSMFFEKHARYIAYLEGMNSDARDDDDNTTSYQKVLSENSDFHADLYAALMKGKRDYEEVY